jgi:hypothetical protein
MRIGILGLGLMRGNLGTIFVLLAMKSSSATRSNDKLNRLARA